MRLKSGVDLYRSFVESWLKDLDLKDKNKVVFSIDEFFDVRFGLQEEEARKLDTLYLPEVFEKVTTRYPDLAEWFKKVMETAGVDLLILQKQPA
jgi:hypothetical protein